METRIKNYGKIYNITGGTEIYTIDELFDHYKTLDFGNEYVDTELKTTIAIYSQPINVVSMGYIQGAQVFFNNSIPGEDAEVSRKHLLVIPQAKYVTGDFEKDEFNPEILDLLNNLQYGDIISVTGFFGCQISSGKADFLNCVPTKVEKVSKSVNLFELINNDTLKDPFDLNKKMFSNVTKIRDYMFYKCKSLTELNLPEGITEIGTGAFRNCSNLETVSLPNSLTYIGTNSFDEIDKYIENSLFIIDGCLLDYYGGSSATGALEIPEGVRLISQQAFSSSYNETFTFPSTLRHINNNAFQYSKLTSAILPANVELGNNIYYSCRSLLSAVVEDGVTKIPESTFSGDDVLESVVIPSSVVEIGDWAFSGGGLKNIYYKGTQTQWNNIVKGYNWDSGSSYTITYNYTGS